MESFCRPATTPINRLPGAYSIATFPEHYQRSTSPRVPDTTPSAQSVNLSGAGSRFRYQRHHSYCGLHHRDGPCELPCWVGSDCPCLDGGDLNNSVLSAGPKGIEVRPASSPPVGSHLSPLPAFAGLRSDKSSFQWTDRPIEGLGRGAEACSVLVAAPIRTFSPHAQLWGEGTTPHLLND